MIPHYVRLATIAIAMLVIAYPSNVLACSMTSNPEITIALGNPAPHTVGWDEVLEGTPSCPAPYFVTVFNTDGSMRLSPLVDCDDVGKRLLIKVESSSGNSVWSYATIVDNLKPVVSASNITVTCVDDIEALGLAAITASDNCTPAESLVYRISSFPSSIGCANGIAQTIVRSIFVIDEHGNRSATVPQTITIERVDIADVVFPANITYLTSDTTICPNAFGTPPIEFPTVNGNEISSICKLLTTVEDETLSSCGASRKILRKYKVLDCCTNEIREAFQVITIMDDQGPTLLTGLGQALQDTITAINIQGNLNCTGTAYFQAIAAQDSCDSSPLTYAIRTQYGTLNSNGGQLNVAFPLDRTTFEAIYEVRDACGNLTTDTVIVRKDDNLPPVAICDEITTVSLATASTTIPAINFDDGSYDNCGVDSFTVRRMGDITWEQEITFTCSDVGDTVLVELRVMDFDGNFNICMVQVIVEDKVPASVNPLPSVTFSCLQNPIDTFFSGVPTVNEVCVGGYTLRDYTDDDSMIMCSTGVQKRRFVFINAAGDTIETTQMITYIDTGTFTIPTSLPDTTIDCTINPLGMPALQFRTDCDVFAVNTSSSATPQVVNCSTTVFRVTYNYMPLCGNGAGFTVDRNITQIDNQGPVWDPFPGDIDSLYACELPSSVLAPTATDDCSTAIVELVDFTSVNLGTPNCPDLTNTYTWITRDLCGNANPTPFVRVIRLKDEVAPNFGVIDDLIVDCKAEIRDTLPAYTIVRNGLTDNCPGVIGLEIIGNVVDTADACLGSIVRTYLATDPCGNSSSAVQTIIYDQTNQGLVINTLDPVIGLQCYADVINYPNPSPQDLGGSACGEGLVITNTFTGAALPTCPATITRTFTVIDLCGNTGSVTQSFTYEDTTPPVLSGITNINVQCQSEVPSAMSTLNDILVTDNCMVVNTTSTDVPASGNTICSGSIVRTYTATDGCSNETTASQTISWNQVGVLTLTPLTADGIVYTCYDEILAVPQLTDPTFFGTGICGINLAIDSVTHSMSPGCGGNVTRSYFISDACNNQGVVTQNFVLNDFNPPTFPAIPDSTLLCRSDLPNEQLISSIVTSTDNCVGRMVSIEVLSTVANANNTDCVGSFVRTFLATDECSNTSTQTRTFTYDQTNRQLVLNALAPVTGLECYDEVTSYPSPSLQQIGIGACGDDLTLTNTAVELPPNTCPATVLRTYTVQDNCGNVGTLTQSFTYNDTTDPVLSSVDPIVVACEGDVPDASTTILNVTATDNCATPVLSSNDVADPSNSACAGEVIRTYMATDDCSNTATVTQRISWGTTGTLTLNPLAGNGIIYDCYDEIITVAQVTDPAVFGEGVCGTALVIDSVNHSTNTGCSGTILRGYYLQDPCGNRDSVFQEFMLDDVTGPTFMNVANIQVNCFDEIPDTATTKLSISVIDNCSGTSANFRVLSNIPTNTSMCTGAIERIYVATDACGNTTTALQTISFDATGSLALDDLAPYPDTLSCFQDVVDFPLITDPSQFGEGLCGTQLTIAPLVEYSQPTNTCLDSVLRFYYLEDGCGNRDTVQQKFIIKDAVGPEFNSPGTVRVFNTPLTGECEVRLSYSRTAIDECGNGPLILSNNAPQAFNPNSLSALGGMLSIGEYYVDFMAEDQCGNTTLLTDTVRVSDPLAPNIDCNPVIFTMEPNMMVNTGLGDIIDSLNIFDLCSPLDIEFTSIPDTMFTCADIGMATSFTVVATDTFGNVTTCATQIGVEDPPLIDCDNFTYTVTDNTPLTLTEADVIDLLNIRDNCTSDAGLTIIFNPPLPLTVSCPLNGPLTVFPFTVEVFDDQGGQAQCDFNISVRDACNSPLMDPFALAGRVDAPLYGGTMDSTLVEVAYTGGSMQTYSDSDGYYSFNDIPVGAISLSAKLPMLPEARVTTYDMFRIGQHVLGTNELENPLLLLAADVNKSGNISAFDLTAIRRVILGVDPMFSREYEATTIGASHPFTDQHEPWDDSNTWGTTYAFVSSDMMAHDISVLKLGDINPTEFLRPRGASELVLEDRYVKAGESVDILVRNDYQDAIAGLQLAVKVEGSLDIQAADENFDILSNTIDGATRISVIQEVLQGEPLMTWAFTAGRSGMLSELINISDDIPNESYSVDSFQPSQLAVRWNSNNAQGAVAEISAFPNPFDNHLSISAHLTIEGAHTLTVSDMAGRSFAERRMEVDQDSWHNFRLDTQKWPAGVFILSLEGPTGRLTQRVVLQR